MQLPIVAIVFAVVVMLLVFIGRVNSGHSAAEAGARYAARTIALARDPAAAVDAARADAAVTVRPGSTKCRSMDFAHTIHPAEVTVTITCQVDLSELRILGVGGRWTATATASEPIDQFREDGLP